MAEHGNLQARGYPPGMRQIGSLFCLFFLFLPGQAATKPHVIVFGKWQSVKLPSEMEEKRLAEAKVRGVFVDGHLKEYTIGLPHDVTDRTFVVQRAIRMNDSLPQENVAPPRWSWQRGGWLLIDRVTGRTTLLNLAAFDSFLSSATWYRDYAAYCGLSDDGTKTYAVVFQLGRRKPLWRTTIEAADNGCGVPVWERDPVRVTFTLAGSKRLTFSVRARTQDIAIASEEAGDTE
jgi:hypothetical protein